MATPSSKTAIANLALGFLKVSAVTSIDPPDEDSKAASVMAKLYDQARRETLEDHVWEFARKRAQIPAEVAEPLFEYSKKYELPSDYVRMVRVGEDQDDPITDYEIEDGYILCNETAPLNIVYIYNIQTVSRFSPKFIAALAANLAKLAAFEITGNASLVDVMRDEYSKLLTAAAAVSGQNRPPKRVQRSKFKMARQTSGNRYLPTTS